MTDKKMPSHSQMRARAKAQNALRHIESAQILLSKACEELCPIDGMVKEWELVGKEYDRVKALWHKVNLRANADDYDLDSDAKARLAKDEASYQATARGDGGKQYGDRS